MRMHRHPRLKLKEKWRQTIDSKQYAGAAKATPAITVFFSDFLERDVRKDKCPPHLRDGAICRTRAPFLRQSATSLMRDGKTDKLPWRYDFSFLQNLGKCF